MQALFQHDFQSQAALKNYFYIFVILWRESTTQQRERRKEHELD